MAWIAALGPVIGALSGIITGAVQKDQSSKAAQALPEPMSFSPTPQMVKAEQMFGKRAEMGLDPAELRLARQGITRSRGVAGRMMENMGLSRLSQGMSNIYGMDAEMNLSALNAKAKQEAMGRYLGVAQGFQNIKDQEVSSFNQMLNQQRMELGQDGAAGSKNILSGIGVGVQGLATNQLANAYANSGDTYNYDLGGGNGAFGGYGDGNGAFGGYGGGNYGTTGLGFGGASLNSGFTGYDTSGFGGFDFP